MCSRTLLPNARIRAGATFAALVAAASLPATASADYPWPKRIDAAERFADGRRGVVSFALVDEAGELRGDHVNRVHNSASVVKAMFMVAYLREPDVRDRDLDAADRRTLGPMIRRSDNQAADAVYERVGSDALYDLANDAKMRRFRTQAVWGLSEITPRDQARFLYRLERFVPERHERYALRLLARIAPSQRWGIPPAAPGGWRLHFKGGWSGRPHWRVNQVMLLRRGERRFSLAILTRDQPSKHYGQQTIEGVARRLLRGYNRLTAQRLSHAPALPGQALKQLAQDPGGGAPDQVLVDEVRGGADRHAAADQAPHREAVAQLVELEAEHGLDLRRVGPKLEPLADQAHERVDLVVGHERPDRRQRPDHVDLVRRQPDLLLRLAQGGGQQRLGRGVAPAAREGDLAGVAAQVGPALGEHEARPLRPPEQRHQDRRLGVPVGVDRLGLLDGQQGLAQRLDPGRGQMITCTVPPSTDQADPAT